MTFFDANSRLGAEMINHEVVNHEGFIILEPAALAENAPELIAYMDRIGIEKALISHSAMLEFDPLIGNKKVLAEIQPYKDRLFPTWVILPEITDSDFKTNVFFDQMKTRGVKILRAYPQVNRYILNGVVMKEQLDIISDLKIPLYLESRYGFEYIYAVLAEFPKLTVVITNIGCWPSGRFVFPLLNRYPNVYFETGDFTMMRGYETACGKFGCERLLFSTNFPTNSMGCAVSALMNSGISIEEKEAIAHKNIERLLAEVKL
jgi:predicted TIM-barrel fold metal-dependent hydrolase